MAASMLLAVSLALPASAGQQRSSPRRPPPGQAPAPQQAAAKNGVVPPSVPAPAGPKIPIADAPLPEGSAYGVIEEIYEDAAMQRLSVAMSVANPGTNAWIHANAFHRYTGVMTAPVTGVYHIRIQCPGSARVWIDDNVIIVYDEGSPEDKKQAQLRLTRGPHRFGMVHGRQPGKPGDPPRRAGPGESVSLWWASGGQWQRIPQQAFVPHVLRSAVLGRKLAELKFPQPLTKDLLAEGGWAEEHDGPMFKKMRNVGVNPFGIEQEMNDFDANLGVCHHWHGVLWIDKPGKYLFQSPSDASVEFEIDGRVVLAHGGQGPQRSKPAAVDLAEGAHPYAFRAFRPRVVNGATLMTLRWQEPGGRELVSIRPEALMHVAGRSPIQILDEKGRPVGAPKLPPFSPAKADEAVAR
jgi:PA14 domain